MAEIIFPAQQFETPGEALIHYGVLGMQWGKSKTDLAGVSRSVNRDASKDATEFARAKMFYGAGAGTRRKLIKATVEAKAKKNPDYKKAFDHHLAQQDLGKHAGKAKSERRRKDVTSSTTKTAKGAHRQMTGGFGNVSLASAILAGALVAGHQAGIDGVMRDAATTRYRDTTARRRNHRSAQNALRDMGL